MPPKRAYSTVSPKSDSETEVDTPEKERPKELPGPTTPSAECAVATFDLPSTPLAPPTSDAVVEVPELQATTIRVYQLVELQMSVAAIEAQLATLKQQIAALIQQSE